MTHGETWLQLGPTSPLINWFRSQGYLNVPQSARLLENLTERGAGDLPLAYGRSLSMDFKRRPGLTITWFLDLTLS